MNKEQRVEVFAKELSWITNSELRNFAEHCLAEVPDYFLLSRRLRQASTIRHTH